MVLTWNLAALAARSPTASVILLLVVQRRISFANPSTSTELPLQPAVQAPTSVALTNCLVAPDVKSSSVQVASLVGRVLVSVPRESVAALDPAVLENPAELVVCKTSMDLGPNADSADRTLVDLESTFNA